MTDEGYILNGLTEKGRNVENIRIPGFYKGNRVIQLAKFTQSNKVTNIVIPPCQTLIEDGFFSSFPKLKAVHILEGNPNNISVGFNLLQGATGVKIYIDKTSISSYLVDYYWSRYSSNLEVDE